MLFAAITSALLFLAAESPQFVGGHFETIRLVHGSTPSGVSGSALAGLPDLDGDGIPEYVVGAPWESPQGRRLAGTARIYSGGSGIPLFILEGESRFDRLGQSVASVGDLNGDGIGDLAVGAPGDSASNPGHGVYIYSGANGAELRNLRVPIAARISFGSSVAGVDDIDGDGVADLLVGAPSGTVPGGSDRSGYVNLYSGATGNLLHTFVGEASSDFFGFAIAGISDVDGDGFGDVIIGAYGHNNYIGATYLYSGRTAALLHKWTIPSSTKYLGISVASIKDLDGDGIDDVLVGAPHSTGYYPRGAVLAFSGASGIPLYRWNGTQRYAEFANFGVAVSSAGDVDQDGVEDIVIGASYSQTGAYRAGSVSLFSGATGWLMNEWDCEQEYASFGSAVARCGDLDQNGHDDIMVGAPRTDVGSSPDAGMVHILGFHPGLKASTNEISASLGSTVDLQFDFPDQAAFLDYKTLISVTGTGPTTFGVPVPLIQDAYTKDSFLGVYPFPQHSALQGILGWVGTAQGRFSTPPGLPSVLVGRSFYLATIALAAGDEASYSSVAVKMTVVP